MILLSQWYDPDDADRLEELSRARKANEASGLFDKTVYLDGGERLSYGEFFALAATHYRGEVCVVANTDIQFDCTASMIEACCKPNRLLALTRWERPYLSPRMIGHVAGEHFFSGSQDTWAFVGGELPRLETRVPLGVVGCDQVVAGWAAASKCEVVNPSLSIRTMHVHQSLNEYEDKSLGGLFGYPEPTIAGDGQPGLVLIHEWPLPGGDSTAWEVVQTCQA